MILRNLHVERTTRVSKILARQDSALFANEQRGAVRVAADVVGADGQVSDLEALDAVDIKALIEDAVLDDGVTLARRHGARTEGVPCSFDVACCVSVVCIHIPSSKVVRKEWELTLSPVNHVLDIFLRVVQVTVDLLLIRVQPARLGRLALLQRHGPAAMLNARRDVPGQGVRIGSSEVHVDGARGAVEGVEGMHSLDFAGVRIHAARRLARLDVAPDHGRHVALVVHEAGVEVGRFVRVGRHDVRAATREGVLEEVEHGEELAGWHHHVVAEPAGNDRVVHHGLVGLVFEVAVPA